MSRQQDKSKDKNPPQTTHDSLPNYELPFQLHNHPPPPSSHSFFDKYKQPDYDRHTAFRLYNPNSPSQDRKSHKKNEIVRKHRGNYRKYTVAQKEEAVKQILDGVDAKEISQKYGIPRRNLLRWKKNGCERKEGGGRPTDGQMQLTLYTKIDTKILLSEKDIRAQAKRLSKMNDFKASKGWYCKFSRRYNQWKKQEHEKAKKEQHDGNSSEKELSFLPEGSHNSDSQSEEQSDSHDPSEPIKLQE